MELDPYSILELAWGASPDAIKAAFRKLAHRHHPDRNRGDRASEERLKLITAAYHRLKESGWSLPRPTSSESANRPAAKTPDDPYVWPEYWADGSPIHYPTAEELKELMRDVEGVARRHAGRMAAMRTSRVAAQVAAYFLIALFVLFVATMLYRVGVDLWWWMHDAPHPPSDMSK